MRKRLQEALNMLRSPKAPPPTGSRIPDRGGAGVAPLSPTDHAERVLQAAEAGDPAAAMAAVEEALGEWPRSADLWFLKFNLQLVAEDLAAAGASLVAITQTDPMNAPGAGVCLELLEAEQQRRDLLREGRGEPGGVGAMSAEVRASLEAVRALAEGDVGRAEAAVQRARAVRAPVRGSIDDQPFRELRDSDDALGPVLEALAPGRYLWLPLAELAWVEFLPLRTFLDHLWMPAHVETRAGEELRVHVPTLYVGSGAGAPRVQLGQETIWTPQSPGLSRATGQRKLVTDRRVLEIRPIRMINFST